MTNFKQLLTAEAWVQS